MQQPTCFFVCITQGIIIEDLQGEIQYCRDFHTNKEPKIWRDLKETHGLGIDAYIEVWLLTSHTKKEV